MGPPLAAQSEGAQAGVGKNWPAATLAEVEAILCAPGQPFEMETVKIRGVPTRVWKNALPNLGALARAARAHGDRLFTIYEDERVSYDAWFRATAALAAEFQRLGISRGDRIALAMRNLPEWPVVFFAATSIGAIITPLNAWWTAGELSYGLSVSGTRLLVCDAERWERLEPEIAALPVLRDIFVSRAENALGAKARVLESVIGRPPDYGDLPEADLPAVAVAPDEDATIFFTSGTSGKPKGAVGAHRNILTNILTSAYGAARSALRRGEAPQPMAHKTGLLVIPLFHVTACNARMVGAMLAGHTLIFMRKWDTIKAFEIIEREKVNSTGGVPTIAWQLLEHPDRGKYDLSSLEAIAYGGAPSAPELVRKIKSEFGALPGNGWGMTETSATVTMIAAEDYLARPDSCGPAAPVGDLKITDDAGVELPVGSVGELWAKGPMVVRGYWNDPEATAKTFIDGWVRTGDLARLDEEGFCYIVDRAKDVIIRGGENIYSLEVENVLYEHPAVTDAALVGAPHRTLGEEPVAVVRLAPGMRATEDELKDFVRARLAAFKTPVKILFYDGVLPRNANGKILKKELRALFAPEEVNTAAR